MNQERVTRDQARTARDENRAVLAHPNVVGIGLTMVEDDYAIKVNLSKETAAGTFPKEVDGVKVVTEVVGEISAL